MYVREAAMSLDRCFTIDMATSLFTLALLLGSTVGLDNGVARTPPMGWNPYNVYLSVVCQSMLVPTPEILDSDALWL